MKVLNTLKQLYFGEIAALVIIAVAIFVLGSYLTTMVF